MAKKFPKNDINTQILETATDSRNNHKQNKYKESHSQARQDKTDENRKAQRRKISAPSKEPETGERPSEQEKKKKRSWITCMIHRVVHLAKDFRDRCESS